MGNAVVKKLAALVVLCLGAMALVFAAPATAADDPYTKGVSTGCTVGVPTELERGERAVVRVGVRANAPADADPVRGTVRVRISRDGEQIWTTRVPYRGRTLQVRGPRLDQAGRYAVTTRFAPDQGSAYRGCSGRAGLQVVNGLITNDDGDDGPQGGDLDTGGLLPDTGGPDSAWLVLALVLLGSGGGLVVAARGRREPDYEF